MKVIGVFVMGMVAVIVFGAFGGLKPREGSECGQIGGKWLGQYKECESTASDAPIRNLCQKYGGEYDECASACRHQIGGGGCLAVCVQVCKLP
jgi:hypothetical protein